MPANHATDHAYSADELEAVYVLLDEALYSLREDDPDDAAAMVSRALVRLGIES
jgi:hypothetical protein